MLKEFRSVRQTKERYRRFFSSEDMDLYVWYDTKKEEISGFQLIYGKIHDTMKAFTWQAKTGSFHAHVDGDGWYNPTPILAGSGFFDKPGILEQFKKISPGIDKEIASLVSNKINEYTG